MMSIAPIEEYWADIRRSKPRAKQLYPDFNTPSQVSPLISWARRLHEMDRQTFQVIPGRDPDQALRVVEGAIQGEVIVRAPRLQGTEDMVGHLTRAIKGLRVPSRNRIRSRFQFLPPHSSENPNGWDLLWCLASYSNLIVLDQLRGMVNRKNARISDFYRALTEIRFEAAEKQFLPAIEENILSLGRWLDGSLRASEVAQTPLLQKANIQNCVAPEERLDLLLFVLSLAQHNHVLDDLILYTDGLENISTTGANDLFGILGSLERWVIFGCPLNLLFGWRGSREDRTNLRSQHARLAMRVRDGMRWIQRV